MPFSDAFAHIIIRCKRVRKRVGGCKFTGVK